MTIAENFILILKEEGCLCKKSLMLITSCIIKRKSCMINIMRYARNMTNYWIYTINYVMNTML